MRLTRLVLLWTMLQAPAYAQDSEDSASTVFRYGSSCNQLAQLTRQEIASVTHPAHAEHFATFCRADGVYSCTDYQALLEGTADLEEAGSNMCRLSPAPGQ